MTFFAEYIATKETRDAIRREKHSACCLCFVAGMIVSLGLIIALAQFGIVLG